MTEICYSALAGREAIFDGTILVVAVIMVVGLLRLVMSYNDVRRKFTLEEEVRFLVLVVIAFVGIAMGVSHGL